MSAPASSATSSASGVFRPQILIDRAMVGRVLPPYSRRPQSGTAGGPFRGPAAGSTGMAAGRAAGRRGCAGRRARAAQLRVPGAGRARRHRAGGRCAAMALAEPGGDAADDARRGSARRRSARTAAASPHRPGWSAENGSNDTVTACRLATAKAMMTTASGTTMMAVTILRNMARFVRPVMSGNKRRPGRCPGRATISTPRRSSRNYRPLQLRLGARPACSAARAFPCRS